MAAILIAGCGFVGNTLALRLCADGHEVWGLRRNTVALPPDVRPVCADLRDSASLLALPSALDAVVYAAAPDVSSDESYVEIYVDGLRRLLDAVGSITNPPERLVLVSSTGVYGQDNGECIDESSATLPTQFSGKRLLESEAIARESGLSSTVVRFGGIYGPGRTALIGRVHRGEARLTRTPSYTNRIHRDDCAGAIAHVLAHDTVLPTVVGVDEDPAERNDVIRWLAERLGLQPQSDAAAQTTSRNKRCSSALLRSTGYAFEYPSYREGYPPIIEEYLRAQRAAGK